MPEESSVTGSEKILRFAQNDMDAPYNSLEQII